MLFPYIKLLLINDIDIINRDTHEDCISYRLAHYMANGIENSHSLISVDNQYNRNGDYPKELHGHNRIPDIIVHERKCNTNNILMIEAKKEALDNNDIEKINYFLREPYFYLITAGILYKPDNPYILLSALTKETQIQYTINKLTFNTEKVIEMNRDAFEYITDIFP